MKFRNIRIKNFMRYKDEVNIAFSTDEEKNVTVVLGDNTFGKTTLAQAFRWCLYEELANTNYNKKKDVVLLNNEVVASMNVNTPPRAVSVEIEIIDGDRVIYITRRAQYRRKSNNPLDMSLSQVGSTEFTMQIEEGGIKGKVISDAEKDQPVSSLINSLLPKNLSNYLFFDGERWNNEKDKKADIKNSIDTILGLAGLLQMLRHLKLDRYNVIGVLNSRIKNNSSEMTTLSNSIQVYRNNAAGQEQTIQEIEQKIEELKPTVDSLRAQLERNQGVEQDQKELARVENDLVRFENMQKSSYAECVKHFSTSARFIASSMYEEIEELFKTIDLEGKDIPGVTVDTIDYLIEHGKCLCGSEICKDNPTFIVLESLKRMIPPESIGGAAGKFLEKIGDWSAQSKTFVEDATAKAELFRGIQDDIDDAERLRNQLINRIDRRLNLADIRRQYETYTKEINKLKNEKIETEMRRDGNLKLADEKQKRLDELSRMIDENKGVNRAIQYANLLYEKGKSIIARRQTTVVNELNDIIRKNFELMFNSKEKYAKLQDDYKVHVYYHQLGDRTNCEETVLSNGETIAINYVFIVSVLELAKRYMEQDKEEQSEHETVDIGIGINKRETGTTDDNSTLQLPLVLDAPFSNLSNENTGLVASHLPEFAEQVIIFMLDKDWDASELGKYTLPEYCYRVHKDVMSNSSTICSERGE